MKFSAKQYALALMDSLGTTDPKDEGKVLDNFVKVLAENNDLRLFDEIEQEFHKLDLAKQGIKQVEVKSAHPLNKENEKAILEELNKIVKGKIELKKEVDERLIGGVVIRMEDQVIDASVKNQLEQLKDNLSN
jgi:F-type H+-transporting ATPase subunit delta